MSNISGMRKGISPLIAAVLLIAFTMGIAGIAGPYFTQLMQQTTGNQDDKTDSILKASKAGFEIIDSTYSSSDETIEITIQNTGSIPIENYTVSAFGDDAKQIRLNETLDQREVKTVKLNSSSAPDQIQVASEEMPVETQQEGDEIIKGSAPSAPTGVTCDDGTGTTIIVSKKDTC